MKMLTESKEIGRLYVIQSRLESEGIKSVLIPNPCPMIQPFFSQKGYGAKLMVKEEDYEAALEVIREQCPVCDEESLMAEYQKSSQEMQFRRFVNHYGMGWKEHLDDISPKMTLLNYEEMLSIAASEEASVSGTGSTERFSFED